MISSPLLEMPHIPVGIKHPGAFGVERKHEVHAGVDLYSPHGSPVFSMERGIVVSVEPFTGEKIGMPWWNDTDVVYVMHGGDLDGRVVAYGEVCARVREGQEVSSGQLIGNVLTVLKKMKNRPMSMLHVEMYEARVVELIFGDDKVWDLWKVGTEKPAHLLDPTDVLLSLRGVRVVQFDPYAFYSRGAVSELK